MKSLLLTLILLSNQSSITDRFIGVAENEHYIVNHSNEGYYIEEEIGIHKDDIVLISNEQIYVIDCKH